MSDFATLKECQTHARVFGSNIFRGAIAFGVIQGGCSLSHLIFGTPAIYWPGYVAMTALTIDCAYEFCTGLIDHYVSVKTFVAVEIDEAQALAELEAMGISIHQDVDISVPAGAEADVASSLDRMSSARKAFKGPLS